MPNEITVSADCARRETAIAATVAAAADRRTTAGPRQRHQAGHAAPGAGGAHPVHRQPHRHHALCAQGADHLGPCRHALPEIEAALAEHGQHLIAEPPDLPGCWVPHGAADHRRHRRHQPVRPAPRRLGRDARPRHGHPRRHRPGEVIHSGGRVLKNVTGLDLCKLLTGSHGTLGVITEVTLKVLPAPEATGTLVLPGLDAQRGVAALSAGSGLAVRRLRRRLAAGGRGRLVPGLAAFRRPVALLRIEDFAPSVAYRTGRLRDKLAASPVRRSWTMPPRARSGARSATRGRWCRRRRRGLARLGAPLGRARGVARRRGRPASPGSSTGAADWSGSPVRPMPPPMRGRSRPRRPRGGNWTLLRAPDTLRVAVEVVPPEAAPLARITRR